MSTDELARRVEELEARSAFQEETIQALNETVTSLNRMVHELEIANHYLAGKLRDVSGSQPTGEAQFEVPPHY